MLCAGCDVKGKDDNVSRIVVREEEAAAVKNVKEVKIWWDEGRHFWSYAERSNNCKRWPEYQVLLKGTSRRLDQNTGQRHRSHAAPAMIGEKQRC